MNGKIRWTNLSHKKIAQLKEQYFADGNPAISMDSKKCLKNSCFSPGALSLFVKFISGKLNKPSLLHKPNH
ncbi:MAG: hypothetical protein GXP56_13410 [Deltaproteobacteria bacterium]|nr:hypothetical protein [Deltaproteobacteria bacterium]